MALTLRYKAETRVPVEIEGFTPDAVRGKPLAQIERFEIFHGNQKLALAEMFDVSGDAGDGSFHFDGELAGVHWIGAHMNSGTIHVHGNAGRHLGSEMTGGEIHVDGDAGDWVGGEMHGGRIRVRGRAGHLIGAAYRGSRRGMTGGAILIGGEVGNEIGHSMRRGLIAVGRAGDMAGFNMIAGSIFVLGDCGIRPGAGMRRGTIGIFGREPPPLLASFHYACRARLMFVTLMLGHLRSLGLDVDESLLRAEYYLYGGDLVALGKGEIITLNQPGG